MREIDFTVAGHPPAKNEAKSMLAAGHGQADRVGALLEAAREAVGDAEPPFFPEELLCLEVVLESPTQPQADATNYLGGIGDVLEAKSKRGPLEHLGELAAVALYTNDHQLQDVRYRWDRSSETRYWVRLWVR